MQRILTKNYTYTIRKKTDKFLFIFPQVQTLIVSRSCRHETKEN